MGLRRDGVTSQKCTNARSVPEKKTFCAGGARCLRVCVSVGIVFALFYGPSEAVCLVRTASSRFRGWDR